MKLKLLKKNPTLSIFLLSSLLIGLSAHSAPRPSDSSQVIYTNTLSQVKGKRQKALTFDKDLNTLSRIEGRYKENLPRLIPASRKSKKRQASRSRSNSQRKTTFARK